MIEITKIASTRQMNERVDRAEIDLDYEPSIDLQGRLDDKS